MPDEESTRADGPEPKKPEQEIRDDVELTTLAAAPQAEEDLTTPVLSVTASTTIDTVHPVHPEKETDHPDISEIETTTKPRDELIALDQIKLPSELPRIKPNAVLSKSSGNPIS